MYCSCIFLFDTTNQPNATNANYLTFVSKTHCKLDFSSMECFDSYLWEYINFRLEIPTKATRAISLSPYLSTCSFPQHFVTRLGEAGNFRLGIGWLDWELDRGMCRWPKVTQWAWVRWTLTRARSGWDSRFKLVSGLSSLILGWFGFSILSCLPSLSSVWSVCICLSTLVGNSGTIPTQYFSISSFISCSSYAHTWSSTEWNYWIQRLVT